jgi:hypothetical protein
LNQLEGFLLKRQNSIDNFNVRHANKQKNDRFCFGLGIYAVAYVSAMCLLWFKLRKSNVNHHFFERNLRIIPTAALHIFH